MTNGWWFAQSPTATDQIWNEWWVIGTALMALPIVDAPMNEHVAEDNAADDGWIEEMVAHDADDVRANARNMGRLASAASAITSTSIQHICLEIGSSQAPHCLCRTTRKCHTRRKMFLQLLVKAEVDEAEVDKAEVEKGEVEKAEMPQVLPVQPAPGKRLCSLQLLQCF